MQRIFAIGNIGVGKTTFSKMLVEKLVDMGYAAVNINLDEISLAISKVPDVAKEISAEFGDFKTREDLAKIVFKDKEALSRLNDIVHPYIFQAMIEQMQTYAEQGADFVVVEETAFSGRDDMFTKNADKVVCVIADDNLRQKRCLQKGLSLVDFAQRTELQVSQITMMECADYIVNNNNDPEHLRAEVDKFITEIL